MPFATTDDGVRLHYEETGSGTPVIFVHEFAGDHRAWEAQMRHFGQRYRAITYAARGYPPSDVPHAVEIFSGAGGGRHRCGAGSSRDRQGACGRACRWAGSPRCISAFATRPGRCRYASPAAAMARRRASGTNSAAEVAAVAAFLDENGIEAFAAKYAYGPTRVQFENKDPRGFDEFKRQLAEHSAVGARNTQLGVQGERPSLYDLVDQMAALTVPTLILTGDEDWPCLQPALLMKQTIPSAALSVMPNCGHTINLEDPDQFNRLVGDFIVQVDAGRWPKRDPRAMVTSITGMK